jgi:hypothetical protein
MRALAHHVWLLLILRHPGSGLPQHWPPVFALITLAALVAALRWEVLYEPYMFGRAIELFAVALALFVWLLLMALISTRFAAAYALVSIGADCISMLLGPPGLLVNGVGAAIVLLEFIALARIATVLWRRARSGGHV